MKHSKNSVKGESQQDTEPYAQSNTLTDTDLSISPLVSRAIALEVSISEIIPEVWKV